MSSDSSRNAHRMLPRRNPSARSVPISGVRLATEAYMVIMAPMIAPAEKMIDSVNAEDADEGGQRLRLLGVEQRFALGLDGQARIALQPRLELVEGLGVARGAR